MDGARSCATADNIVEFPRTEVLLWEWKERLVPEAGPSRLSGQSLRNRWTGRMGLLECPVPYSRERTDPRVPPLQLRRGYGAAHVGGVPAWASERRALAAVVGNRVGRGSVGRQLQP